MELRPYQREAVDAVYAHLRERDDNPCVVIPTAGGKTPVMATICRDAVQRWGGRVLILAHVKELLQQAADKLRATCFEVPVGVYSAGLRKRDLGYPVTVAGIQSVHRRACELDRVDLVLVDEAHLIPPDGEGMYRRFLADMRVVNPNVRVVGLTATPFRLKSGSICAPEHILNHVCYEVGVRQLIADGYLCPLVTKAGAAKADMTGLHVRGGEFVAAEAEALMDEDGLVRAACAEIAERTRERKACLIFTTGVAHAHHVARTLVEAHGLACGVVTGETPAAERDATLARFRSGELRHLANVNVLTTGFDAPHIDCVALLRPTMSPGLYYQMVGRGFRLHPDKRECLVLDYGGNVLRHGPVDALRLAEEGHGSGSNAAPAKECPECASVIAAGYTRCPDCGYEFPPPDSRRHEAKASAAGILSGQFTDTEHGVRSVHYSVHTKRGADESAPKTMRVEYEVGWNRHVSEWICFEHTGYARRKAEAWWRERCEAPAPDSAELAVQLANEGALAEPSAIVVRETAGEDFPRIVGYQLSAVPAWREPGMDQEEPAMVGTWLDDEDDCDVPF